MGSEQTELESPDLVMGVPITELSEGKPFLGHAQGEPVVLVRRGDEVFAVGASCTHYGGPLGEGLVVEDTIRCPWHHACFSLRTGEAVGAPALNPVPCWKVEVRDGRALVTTKEDSEPLATFGRRASGPESVVIVGAGAAGSAAAEMLRREGYEGRITMIDPDPDAPYDRPNLSKDYLAGNASPEWIPLRPPGFYEENGIERESVAVESIDVAARTLRLIDGRILSFGSLLLATGATPIPLPIPGFDLPHVHLLRSLADCESIIEDLDGASRVVVVGASFIGMETAASLRTRGLQVTVVAPEAVPFERTLGTELGRALMETHEEHGVAFRLGHTAKRIDATTVWLDDGSSLAADLVIVGVGVRPDLRLAEAAGLRIDDGVVVDERMETSAQGVFAAGDIARYPDAYSGELIRVEHWVAAQRQGQAAARGILGREGGFADPPFFWTRHWDFGLAYVGHAKKWDDLRIEGDPRGGDAAVSYVQGGKARALATVGRDLQSLNQEAAMEAAGLGNPLVPERPA